MTETHTPLPCPFCGHQRRYNHADAPCGDRRYWTVICEGCEAHGPPFSVCSGGEAEALTAWNTRAVNSHHDLIEALREADVDLVGAEMLLQNKSINATGALADTGWKPGREHIEGMQRTINQALAEIASARAILTKAEAGHG